MDVNQIKKYLPAGWDVVDLIDHGIIDLDIMNGKMMGGICGCVDDKVL